ncbi:macro domain-containing protein [Lujinxingia vulgaris]|nr:macro domain-containing protein [Lujinxingia vulgaris]
MEDSKRHLIVTQGDITLISMPEGALVNPSNTGLILNSGGNSDNTVSNAIARRGGPFMQQTLHMTRSGLRNNRLEPGRAVDTEAGQLPVKRLIHVSIVGAKKINARLVSNAILNAYDLADELELKELAFPAIGLQMGGITLEEFMEIFWRITAEELPRLKHVRQVYLCLFSGEEYEAGSAYAEQHVDELPESIDLEISESGFARGIFG